MNTPTLDKFLAHHARTCTFWIFSGDRHCSCGRDKALEELQALKAEAEKIPAPLPLFGFVERTEA